MEEVNSMGDLMGKIQILDVQVRRSRVPGSS